jgi:hypothetical protein
MWENIEALLVDRVDDRGSHVGWWAPGCNQAPDVLDRGGRLRGPLRFGGGVLRRTIAF